MGSISPLFKKKILLVISGGIAAYKSVELARLLTHDGAEVQTVLTQNALSFVQPPKNTPDVVQDADWDDAMNASKEELNDALDMF